MGPVWVDMFYTWQADGRLAAERQAQADRARHARAADVLRDARPRRPSPTSRASSSRSRPRPEVQAEGIVKQFNWYPGIDAEHIQAGDRRGDLGQAVRRRHARGARVQGQAVPDRPLLRRHPRGLRAAGRELRRQGSGQGGVRPARPSSLKHGGEHLPFEPTFSRPCDGSQGCSMPTKREREQAGPRRRRCGQHLYRRDDHVGRLRCDRSGRRCLR